MMWTNSFWKETAERAVKTFAQTLVASGIVVGVAGWDKWQAALIASALAAVLSVVTSVASAGIGDKGSPSLVSEQLVPNVGGAIPEADLEPGTVQLPYIGTPDGQPHPGDNFDSTGLG